MEGSDVWLGCHTRLEWLIQPCYPSFGMLFQMENAEMTNEHKYLILYLVTKETVLITHFFDSLCWSLLLSQARVSPLKKKKIINYFPFHKRLSRNIWGKCKKKKKGIHWKLLQNCFYSKLSDHMWLQPMVIMLDETGGKAAWVSNASIYLQIQNCVLFF